MEVAAFFRKTTQQITHRLLLRPGQIRAAAFSLLLLVFLLSLAGVRLANNHREAARAGAASQVVVDHPIKAVHASFGAVETAAAQNSAAVGGGAPALELPADFFDFGSLDRQAVVRHEFFLVNQGSAPLLVQRAYTTCGCTSAELSASVIPPGKASRVTVTFDAGFHPAAGQTVRRGVVIETNDPQRPQVEIWVQARVRE